MSLTGSSGSDCAVATAGHKTMWEIKVLTALKYMSTLKKLKKMIAAQIAEDYRETFNKEFYSIFFAKGCLVLPNAALDEA